MPTPGGIRDRITLIGPRSGILSVEFKAWSISMASEAIIELIDRFVSKTDVSVSLAKEIEAVIDDQFPDDEYMQDTVEMLASYRPGGDEFLCDEGTLIDRLNIVKNRLQSGT